MNKFDIMVKIKIYIFLFCVFYTTEFIAQQPTEEWVRRYPQSPSASSSGESIKSDSLGYIYVLADTGSSFGFIKYDPDGNLLFTASYWPGGFSSGYGTYFDVTPNGNVYITGVVYINLDEWIYTVKYNPSGVFQWGKLYNPDNADRANDVKVDKNGDIIVAGVSRVGSITYALTIKYNSNGDTLWTKHFNNGQNSAVNYKVALDDSNNICIVGRISFPGDCLVLKYDPEGNLNWFNRFTLDSSRTNSGSGIALDSIGNIYIVGTQVTPPFSNIHDYLLKITNGGIIQWSRLFGSVSNGGYITGPVVSSDCSSIYYLTMFSNGTGGGGYSLATLKYNSAGDSQWVKVFNGGGVPATANFPGSIKLDKFDNIYICGLGYYQTTGNDFVTVKYTPAGIQQWVARYTGIVTNGGDAAKEMLIDTSQNVFVTGRSSSISNPPGVAVTIKYNQPIGIIPNNNQLPEEFRLYQNFPNPFNPVTMITYQLPKTSEVKLSVFNILGAEVKTLVNYKQVPGKYSIALNMENYSSGIYFYSLMAGNDFIETKKLILLK